MTAGPVSAGGRVEASSGRRGRALLLSGGPHPFADTTPVVSGLLTEAGYEVEVVDTPDAAAEVLLANPPELWVCNTLRWRMLAAKYDELRSEFAYSTTAAVRAAFDSYVRGGGRLLALHGAPICFDDWPGWGDLVGARWDWERASHPPLGDMEVRVVCDHPITDGVDRFSIRDEAYGHMQMAADLEPLVVSSWGGQDHPMLWIRRVDQGVVVTSTLGHGLESFQHPSHARLLRQAIEVLSKARPQAGITEDSVTEDSVTEDSVTEVATPSEVP